MLALAFASGGRRRSEISRLTAGNLRGQSNVVDEATGVALPPLALSLGRTKAAHTDTDVDTDAITYVSGAPVGFLAAWMRAADITGGPVFRSIDRCGPSD